MRNSPTMNLIWKICGQWTAPFDDGLVDLRGEEVFLRLCQSGILLVQRTQTELQEVILDSCKNKPNFLLWHYPVVVSCIINSQSNFKQ